MALSAWQATIVNKSGDVIPSASVEVIDEATGLQASIFEDSGGTALGNPFNADTNGFAQFYANAGTYRIIASDSGTGFSETWEDQRLGDAQARDVGTGADQLPSNSDLGTAAQVDTGTASSEVPTYGDLYLESVADIENFTPQTDDQQIIIKGWHPDSDVGGGDFYVDLNRAKSDHNGGTVLSLTVPWNADPAIYNAGTGETDPSGNGCVVRKDIDVVKIEDFGGGVAQTGDNNVAALNSAADQCSTIELLSETSFYSFSSKPNLKPTTTCLVKYEQGVSGVSLEDLQAIVVRSGSVNGVAFSPEMRGKTVEIVAGTIRQNPIDRTKWDWIKDSAHEPIGVDDSTPATAIGSKITVNFLKTYSRVLSLVCGPDESLANSIGLCVGASVGLDSIEIKASADITLAATIRYDGSDWVWTYGVAQGGGPNKPAITSVSNVGSNVTIDHEWIPGADISLTPFTNDGAVLPYIPALRKATDYSAQINFINYSGAFVSTADTSMSCLMTKSWSEGIRLDGVDNGDVLELDSGNIWFYGIFEV